MTNCSVSLKLETLPFRSIPREKYRVPTRWRERRAMRPSTKAWLLIVTFLTSKKPNTHGKMKRDRSWPPDWVVSINFCMRKPFQKKRSSVRCQRGADLLEIAA